MPDHEPMTESVHGPGLPIHDPILEDDMTGECMIQGQNRLNRVSNLVFQKIGNSVNPGADLLEISLQALFVM